MVEPRTVLRAIKHRLLQDSQQRRLRDHGVCLVLSHALRSRLGLTFDDSHVERSHGKECIKRGEPKTVLTLSLCWYSTDPRARPRN